MDLILKNWKIFLIIIFLYIIFAILFLVYIWHPNDSYSSNFKYNQYTEQQANDKLEKIYEDKITGYLLNRNYMSLYKLMSKEFLDKNNLNENNFNQYLEDNYYFANKVTTNGYQITNTSNSTIYSISYRTGLFPNTINVIETTPFSYTLSFGNDYTEQINNGEQSSLKDYTSNGIKFSVVLNKSDSNTLYYTFNITNQDNENVKFDFSDINKIKLYSIKLDKYYRLSNVDIHNSNDDILTKGSSINRDFSFEIPMNSQTQINSIIFYNVNINGNYTDVTINI